MTTQPTELSFEYQLQVTTLNCPCGADRMDVARREASEPVFLSLDERTFHESERIMDLAGWVACQHHESRAAEYVERARRVTAQGDGQPRLAKLYMRRALEENIRDYYLAYAGKLRVKTDEQLKSHHRKFATIIRKLPVVQRDQVDADFLARMESAFILGAILGAVETLRLDDDRYQAVAVAK